MKTIVQEVTPLQHRMENHGEIRTAGAVTRTILKVKNIGSVARFVVMKQIWIVKASMAV